MLLGTLAASLLGSAWTGKGIITADEGVIRAGESFHGVYSRNNLSKIKNGAYIINIDVYELIGTCWIALYVNAGYVTYFDSFGVEHIPKEIRKFTTNISRIQA